MTSTQRNARFGLVRLKTGRAYEGRVEVDPPFVHFSGRRRVHDGSYRPADDHTWPANQVEAIRWSSANAAEGERLAA
jgi:hypothetical protein